MRRVRAEGVPRENTDANYKTAKDHDGLVFASVFSREAGRFAAGERDASPQSSLTLPAEKNSALRVVLAAPRLGVSALRQQVLRVHYLNADSRF